VWIGNGRIGNGRIGNGPIGNVFVANPHHLINQINSSSMKMALSLPQ
jgi:hypothetical protein